MSNIVVTRNFSNSTCNTHTQVVFPHYLFILIFIYLSIHVSVTMCISLPIFFPLFFFYEYFTFSHSLLILLFFFPIHPFPPTRFPSLALLPPYSSHPFFHLFPFLLLITIYHLHFLSFLFLLSIFPSYFLSLFLSLSLTSHVCSLPSSLSFSPS